MKYGIRIEIEMDKPLDKDVQDCIVEDVEEAVVKAITDIIAPCVVTVCQMTERN